MNKRIAKLKQKLIQNSLESLVVFNQYNITYLTGFTGHAATLLMTPLRQILITDYRYLEQAENQAISCEVICRDRTKQSLGNLIRQLLKQDLVEKLGFEAEHISVSQWRILSDEIQLQQTIATTRLVEDLRIIKDEQEIDAIRNAAHIADQALAKTLALVRTGVTEKSLAIELEYQMSLLGSEQPAFDTILLTGERSALPHGIPGDKKIVKGDLLLFDFGAVVNGYRSDMTRTYVVGQPSQQQNEIFNLVKTAQQTAIDSISAGVTGEYLAQKSDAILDASEYGKYKGEGLGHGVGLELHEYPFMGKGCDLKIQPGCVITIEPGIYIPGWGGIRIEDDVVLLDKGLEILNQSSKEFIQL